MTLSCAGCRKVLVSQLQRNVSRAAASKTFETIHHVEDLAKSNLRAVGVGSFNDPKAVLRKQLLTPVTGNSSETVATSSNSLTTSKLTKHYSSLSKFRLTGLVVCSAVTGYAMAPPPTDLTTLTLCLVGTALTSASANTINQFFEVPFDSQMARTSNRVLVQGLLRYA